MYRVPVFTLGTTLSPYTTPHTHTQTRASARADPALSLSPSPLAVFFFLSLFFPLDPAISRASCASFVLLVPHTRACIYSYARLVSHSRNRTNSLIQLVSRSSVFFSFFFSCSSQPPSRVTALAPSGRRAAAARRE